MSDEVTRLIQDALASIKQPYPDDIIDRVCWVIHNDVDLSERYHKLANTFDKSVINPLIGSATRDLTGLKSSGERRKATCPLIGTYSVLK